MEVHRGVEESLLNWPVSLQFWNKFFQVFVTVRTWEVDKTPKPTYKRKAKNSKHISKTKAQKQFFVLFSKRFVCGGGARLLRTGDESEWRRHKNKSPCVFEESRASLVQSAKRAWNGGQKARFQALKRARQGNLMKGIYAGPPRSLHFQKSMRLIRSILLAFPEHLLCAPGTALTTSSGLLYSCHFIFTACPWQNHHWSHFLEKRT